MDTNNIIKWCDKYLYMLNTLKSNYNEFVAHEIPHMESNYDDISKIESNVVCVNKIIDKYFFILGMISPSSIYNLIEDKIFDLKNCIHNLVNIKHYNDHQLNNIVNKIDPKLISYL